MDCFFLDGSGQDIPDIDVEAINARLHVDYAVNAAFFADGERKKKAIEEVGRLLSSQCFFIRQLTSKSISKITGYNDTHHKIPTC